MSSRGAVGDGLSADEAFDLLPHVLTAVAGAPMWQYPDSRLGELVQVFARSESQCAAAGVAVLAEAAERGLPVAAGAKDAAGWFRGLVPVTPQLARQREGLASAFGPAAKPNHELAPVAAAFQAGAISAGHAAAVARTMAAVSAMPEVDDRTRAEAQQLLLEAGTKVDPSQLGRAGLRLRHRLDPDAAERLANDEDAQAQRREGYLVQEGSGMWLLHGVLPALAGATVKAALDPLCQPHPMGPDGARDERTSGMRFVDGLTALAELSLAARGADDGELPSRGGAPTRLVVTAELATLLADLSDPDQTTGLVPPILATGDPGGWQISPLSAQMLACDADVVPVLTDGSGRALDVGDTVYAFPPRIRRAIEVRDQYCTFPGCTSKAPWCHVHHLVPFSRGGPTSEANGALLCGRHHRFVHASGWFGEIDDGQVVWRSAGPGHAGPDRDDGADDIGRSNAHLQQFEQALRTLALRHRHRRGARDPDD